MKTSESEAPPVKSICCVNAYKRCGAIVNQSCVAHGVAQGDAGAPFAD